jgi:hypothetical protein
VAGEGQTNSFAPMHLASVLRGKGRMMRIAGVSALLLATGCLVESSGEDLTPTDLLGRICTVDLAITGNFVQSKAPPPHEDGTPYTGCWPIGTWTFSATIGQGDCKTQAPQLLAQYQFKVEEMLDQDGIPYQVNTYMTDPTVRNRVKVSQGGAGLCEGELNLFSVDGKEVTILKPGLYADLRLEGSGEFQVYGSDQWIGDAGGN